MADAYEICMTEYERPRGSLNEFYPAKGDITVLSMHAHTRTRTRTHRKFKGFAHRKILKRGQKLSLLFSPASRITR